MEQKNLRKWVCPCGYEAKSYIDLQDHQFEELEGEVIEKCGWQSGTNGD